MINLSQHLKPFALISIALGLFMSITSISIAQDVSIELEVSSKKIALGSAIQVTITVHGVKDATRVQLPAINGFDVKYLGPSTRVSIVNGQYSTSKSFIYSLYPLKVGKFQIPSSNLVISGKRFTLPAIPLEVVGSMGQMSSSDQEQPTSLKDKLFIALKVPKLEVYLNEPLPVKVLLFVSGLSARDIQYPDFNNIGFTIGEYERPKQYQQVVNGLRYDIVEFNSKIYPTRIGELRVGPAKVECNVLVKSQRNSRFGSGSSVFDDDFFNSFFDRNQKRPITLESDQVVINVIALPEEGKPTDFTGAVGQYDLNVSLSPNNVKEGDPITMIVTIIGKGNLSTIKMPSLPIDAGFKLYDAQIFEKNNIKKSEQVVIPQTDEVTQVPAIKFSFFDPQLRKYRTITKGPFPITVTKLESDENFKVVGLEGEFRTVILETLGEDIVFIKVNPGNLRLAGQFTYNSIYFYISMILAAILWAGVFFNFKRTHRIKTDTVYARRL